MIIVIAASLFSKIHNKVSLREEFTFEEMESIFFRSSSFHAISFALEIFFEGLSVTIRSPKSSVIQPQSCIFLILLNCCIVTGQYSFLCVSAVALLLDGSDDKEVDEQA